jgi:hypothetical protein
MTDSRVFRGTKNSSLSLGFKIIDYLSKSSLNVCLSTCLRFQARRRSPFFRGERLPPSPTVPVEMAVNELVSCVRCSSHTLEELEDSCRWFTFNDIVPRPPSRTRERPATPVAEKTHTPQPTPIIKKTRIPLELQLVFLASNRGEKVDKPPTSGAFLCRNWQDRANGSKAKKASKKVCLHEEQALKLDISPVLSPERSKTAHFLVNEPTWELDNEIKCNVQQPLALSKGKSSRWESGPREGLPGVPSRFSK